MGLFKKLGRGIKKVVKKNKGGLTRLVKKAGPGLVLGAVTGGIGAGVIAKAASAAKTLGKKAKGLETPKSLVPVVRAAEIRVKKSARTKMPGGAPMPHIPSVKVRDPIRSTPQAKRTLYTSAKKPKKAKSSSESSSGRKAPSAAQLAARAKFTAMVKARAAAKKRAA